MGQGRLRIYLGAAPGVGKTFAMLDEGRRRLDRGTDVVIGMIDTHGRPGTIAMAEGFEIVPTDTKGDLNTAAIIERKPAVVLIDDFAHRNGETRRWREIAEIQAAGIDVITTVSIDTIESLQDAVSSILGHPAKETVPDEVVRGADQIELVDMSPEALRRRMAHGNIFPAEQIDAALSDRFREGNLIALRELALLWLADRVDEALEQYRVQHGISQPWGARERIVVAVPNYQIGVVLMRRAAQLAGRRAGGEWHAIYITNVENPDEFEPPAIVAIREFAEELGGALHVVKSSDTAQAITDFARNENARHIIMGASRRGRISHVLRSGTSERVVDLAHEIDVHIVTHEFARTPRPKRQSRPGLSRRRVSVGFILAAIAPPLIALLLTLSNEIHEPPAEAMVFMAAVVGVAIIGGLVPAVIAAVSASLLLTVLFTPPLYQLEIAEPRYGLAIVLFTAIGIAVASVVSNSARRSSEARLARSEADALMLLSHSLITSADDVNQLLTSAMEFFEAQGAAIMIQPHSGETAIAQSVGNITAPAVSTDVTSTIATVVRFWSDFRVLTNS